MCLICQELSSSKKGENPYFVKELETGYLVVGDHQYFEGYSLFLAKEHVTELHHLKKETRLHFLEEMESGPRRQLPRPLMLKNEY